jgi:hypothetical protein
LPVKHPLRDQEGELHDIAFGAAPQVGSQGHDLRDRLVQALEHRLQFGPRLLIALLAA